MVPKLKYPRELLSLLGLNTNSTYLEKSIIEYIMNKCTKRYGTIYNMPDNIYQTLIANHDIYHNHDVINNQRQVRLSDIRRFIKGLGITSIPNNIYISVSDIYNTNIVNEITVQI
jgi:hypothetical protein